MGNTRGLRLLERNGGEHVRTIDAELLRQELESGRRLLIVDVRSTVAFHGPGGRIPGALSIPMHQLLARRCELASHRNDVVVIVSKRGVSSRFAGLELEFAGFTEVRSLEGGMSRWAELGYPIEHSDPES